VPDNLGSESKAEKGKRWKGQPLKYETVQKEEKRVAGKGGEPLAGGQKMNVCEKGRHGAGGCEWEGRTKIEGDPGKTATGGGMKKKKRELGMGKWGKSPVGTAPLGRGTVWGKKENQGVWKRVKEAQEGGETKE